MRKWLFGLALLILIMTGTAVHLIASVFAERSDWRQEGISLAKHYTAMETIEQVSLYAGKDSYIVVLGKNAAGAEMIAWFKNNNLERFDYMRIMVKADAIRNAVLKEVPSLQDLKIQPGMEDGRPIWEAVFRDNEGKFNYYYYDMKTGSFIRSYRLQKENE